MDCSPSKSDTTVPLISEFGTKTSDLKLSDDQYFLLYLIMGTYFGPDIYEENPKKCIFQRLHETLPSYTTDMLSNSQIRMIEIESIYYYVLRKADKSVVVKREWLNQFFHGNLPNPEKDFDSENDSPFPQFPHLFPPQFHPHSGFKSLNKTIGNIVFISNPTVSYFKPEIIERFKRLSGLEEFLLDKNEVMLHMCIDDEHFDKVMDKEMQCNGQLVVVEEVKSDDNVWEKGDFCGTPMVDDNVANLPFEPGMVFLPKNLTREDWENIAFATKGGTALTGTAAMGQMGPVVGLMDIGECDDSYLFRVALPGIIRDERDFGCEVESHGKVMIRGVTTTGEKKVHRYLQEFEMQTQNLCPPGDFSISFYLPGPVDPQQFSGNFGTDGILEGIVVKATVPAE